MDPVVILDTNVLLARCLDPSMDAKADLAREVFEVLSEEKILPCITEAIRREFDNKLEARVGQIIEAVRGLAQAPGLPKAVVQRARDVLAAFENGAGPARRRPSDVPPEQLALAPTRPQLLDELAALDVDAMTPLEALTKLYEVKKKAQEGSA